MNPIATTMPEAKFRSTKKQVQPVASLRTSEFAHEVKAFQPGRAKAAAKAESKSEVKAESKTASKQSRIKIVSFWPVAVGIFLAGFAAEWQSMLAQAGIWAVRLAFPLSQLTQQVGVGIDSQIALYAQLPIDGLVTMLALVRGKSLKSAVAQIFLMHGVSALVLWLLTFAN